MASGLAADSLRLISNNLKGTKCFEYPGIDCTAAALLKQHKKKNKL